MQETESDLTQLLATKAWVVVDRKDHETDEVVTHCVSIQDFDRETDTVTELDGTLTLIHLEMALKALLTGNIVHLEE